MASNRPKYTLTRQAVAKPCAQNVAKKRLYSIKELVREVGCTEWYWRTKIWDGQLPFVQVGRKMFIDGNDVERYINNHKHQN